MHTLSWREVDFVGVAIAGFIAGYVTAISGLWAGKVPGLATMDFADFGRRYMASDSAIAWLFGLVSHLTNSVLLTFLWASLIAPNSSQYFPKIVSGILWGEFLALTLSGALVAPMSGMGFLGRKTGDPRIGVTNALLHGLWGALIGLVYVPK